MSTVKALLSGLAVACLLTAITCTDDPAGPGSGNSTDAEAVALDRSALAITYASGDNAGYVTQNVGLPASGANGSTISWVTSASSRITTEGVVTRPAAGTGDASVTLTATISKGTASDVKVFTLTVKEIGAVAVTDADAVAADKSALTITYASGDNAGYVTQNVGLPASGANGSSISWVTSTSSRITTEGVVTRPAAGTGDASVTLTATIAKGTASDVKVFSLTVKAIGSVVVGPGTMTDQDGNVYKTVKIGNQEWMAENLKTTKYSDGTPISHVPDSASWYNLYLTSSTTGAYCYYDNSAANMAKYGALYNWYAVNTGKLAPAGWHVPTDAEWTTMETYLVLNGYNWDGTTDTSDINKIAKALAAKTDWASSTNPGAIGNDLTLNNRSGFSALGGGYRNYHGTFRTQGGNGSWWSATEDGASDAFARFLSYDFDNLSGYPSYVKSCGFSVRLVRD